LLSSSPRPTAILATSDQLALGALDGAPAQALAVPDELSVIGLDDTPAAVGARPPLTTVHQDTPTKADGLADWCSIDGQPLRGDAHLLPHRLVVRETTTSAPGDA
jgi:DNA-binding LacI/PurR family transcriptional regulator